MERKSKKIWIIGGLVLCLVAVIGITFAFFSAGGTQDTANTFTSGCLNIELTDASASIKLTNTYPISDVEGVDSTSYDFTVRNTCDTSTNYSINLESLNQVSNSLNADYIKVSLSSDTFDNVISKLSDNIVATPEIDGAYESYTLYTGNLGANETKTYHLKLWIDYDATVEQAANKTYLSKINVIANPETNVVDTLEAKFSLDDKTLTSSLSSNVTNATYCTTTTNICEPTTPASITNNSYTVELEENDSNQMVCTQLNGTSKVICSNGLEVKKTYICKGPACESILANMTEFRTRTDFSTTIEETATGVIYKSANESQYDEGGEVYYFAGNPTDNWFYFGGYYWRIVRINGDGSIRMIYSGNSETGPVTTGEGTQIGTSVFNSSLIDNMYVGYMYTQNEVHGLTTNSSIKTTIDNWYLSNLADEAEYLDGNAGFCGDRTPYSGTGTGTSTTYYGASNRLYTNKAPTFKCTDKDNDLYTTPGSSKGNGALKVSISDNRAVPIGLITADEVAFAGGVYGSNNTSYYLYTGQLYWTMSPMLYDEGASTEFVIFSEFLASDTVTNPFLGIRPVINIRADIELTGSGTTSDPFKVVGAS